MKPQETFELNGYTVNIIYDSDAESPSKNSDDSVFITKDTSEITEPEKCAEGLVEQWNQYLSGDVWGYEIEDPDGVHVDSCCGFYGLEYCKEEARNAVPDVTPVPLTTLSQSCVGAGI